MERICLDFETALDFLRGDPATIEKLKYYADREEICITSFTMLHLQNTINKPDVVRAFANSVTVLAFDKKSAQIATRINHDLMGSRELPKVIEDTITAAICIANDAFLYSRSLSKYDGIKGLRKV